VILLDSSAWVEYLRDTEGPVRSRVRDAVKGKQALATSEVILMEILAGARDDSHRDRLRRMLHSCWMLAVEGPADYEQAAELYRVCRRGGETPRKMSDCLIAAVAIRNDVPVLHADADFLAIARYTALQLVSTA
jgi:predicted nucleic acid-binding protein